LRGVESIKLTPRYFPPPEKLGIDEQGKEGATGQFHEPVVPDQGRKIPGKLKADAPQVIPFETTVAAEREQQDDGHHLA
jgi:hypothetical protein